MLNLYLGTARLLGKFCPEFIQMSFNKIYQNITPGFQQMSSVAYLVNLAPLFFLLLF